MAYHFHQFPTLFLITNLVAVPLSSLLIFATIALLVAGLYEPAGFVVGKIIQVSIQFMNEFVSRVAAVPYSLIDGISFTIPQVVFLFAAIAAAGWWLLRRSASGLVAGMFALGGFCVLAAIKYVNEVQQQELIVYNIPQHTAIDIVGGRQYRFVGDEELLEDGFLRNFHLKPSRVQHQMQMAYTLPNVSTAANALQLGNVKVVIVSSKIYLSDTAAAPPDVLIITGNPNIDLADVNQVFHPKMIVADASNKFYRINQWQEEASQLHLPFHAVSEQGAFVIKWK